MMMKFHFQTPTWVGKGDRKRKWEIWQLILISHSPHSMATCPSVLHVSYLSVHSPTTTTSHLMLWASRRHRHRPCRRNWDPSPSSSLSSSVDTFSSALIGFQVLSSFGSCAWDRQGKEFERRKPATKKFEENQLITRSLLVRWLRLLAMAMNIMERFLG